MTWRVIKERDQYGCPYYTIANIDDRLSDTRIVSNSLVFGYVNPFVQTVVTANSEHQLKQKMNEMIKEAFSLPVLEWMPSELRDEKV